ncbi:MAG: 5-oxoprolinase subunit PxpA [Verrucomicrobiota bacterium]
MRSIDLNADLGEGGMHDAALLELVSSANIACGGHAGDEETMRRSIELALESGVAIGAHPGYEDREHFGRLAMVLPLEQVTDLVRRQVEALASLAKEAGARLHHVKPHGALYNQASRDPLLAAAVVAGITRVSAGLTLYALPASALAEAGRAAGLTVCAEGFADRRYRLDGSLMPRGEPGAVIKDVDAAVAQALELASSGRVETLCVHGDGVTAVAILRALRDKLGEAHLTVRQQLRN